MPSASLVGTETVHILVPDVLSCHRRTVKLELVLAETEVKLAVERKSRCRWLLEEMQPKTDNGWIGPLDSVQFSMWRLGSCKHL